MVINKEFNAERLEEIKRLYEKQGWVSYLKNENKLKRSFENSIYMLGAFEEDKLIGFIRCVGDGEHVIVVQDLLVDKDYQQRGIGSKLFKIAMIKYSDVRLFMVVTDKEDKVDNKLYQGFGLKKIEEKGMVTYIR